MKKILLFLCIFFIIGTAGATNIIATDDNNPDTKLQANSQNRIFSITYLNIPSDAENITFQVHLSQFVRTSVDIQIANTTDYKNTTGDVYTTNITGLTTPGTWYNITVPNTYDFQGNVIIRFLDSGTKGFAIGADATEDNQRKLNWYYDGSTWVDKTLLWTPFVRLYYDGTEAFTPGTIKVGTYLPNTNPTGGSSVNGGTAGRSYLVHSNRARIRQDCNITKIQLYVDVIPTTFTVDFWRENDGGGYDLIGQTDNIAGSLTPGFNSVSGLNISVKEGDYYGITIGEGGVYKTTADTYGTLYYTDMSNVQGTGYNWAEQTSLSSLSLNLALFTDSIDAIFIGDSIIAGHPAHYSYIESYATHTDPTDTISYIFGNLTGYTTQNMGIGGQTTTNIAARIGLDLIRQNPAYAIIDGGVNDVAVGATNETILANVEYEIESCHNIGITPVLFLILPWTNGDINQTNQVNYLNDQYEAFEIEYPGTIIVDARQEVGDLVDGKYSIKPEYDADGVHFNAAGYAKIAEVLAGEVPSTLNADFTVNTTTGDKPLTVQFTDISFGVPYSWAWDFTNDGTVDNTTQNPIYTYDTAGNYTVNLTVTNEYGSDSEVKTEYIRVTSGDDFRNLISLINAFINAFKNMRLHVVEAVWQTL